MLVDDDHIMNDRHEDSPRDVSVIDSMAVGLAGVETRGDVNGTENRAVDGAVSYG